MGHIRLTVWAWGPCRSNVHAMRARYVQGEVSVLEKVVTAGDITKEFCDFIKDGKVPFLSYQRNAKLSWCPQATFHTQPGDSIMQLLEGRGNTTTGI